MPPASPEYQMIRTYFDWVLDVPWSTTTEDRLDPVAARQVLDEDHYDLDKVKERIVEYLAVQKLKAQRRTASAAPIKGPILCFVGPPGVGKTSLGQSIARAMNRKFVRISLGGVRDEAEIRGHRRTYIGAIPGRIVQALKQAGAMNPVFMLDEIDKITRGGFQGDPAAALLEVLDPSQNHSFRDHYLEINVDLSRVLFIATANQLGTIHPALLDRMEIISLAGYTEEEKVHIARQYLIPRQLEEHGLTPDQVAIEDDAVRRIIAQYTREAGVRNLERQIGAVARKIAARVAGIDAADRPRRRTTRSTAATVPDYLGPPKIHDEVAFRVSRPGVATGVAWTESGGDVLFIEASLLPAGHGNITLTGQLGNVMQESARAAVSHIRSMTEELGVAADFLDNHDLHIHVPAGAIPKDGPSAGVTMATAIVSALKNQTIREDVAMTGEITLERPGAAGRRHPREGARRAAARHQDVHPSGAQRSRTWRSCLPKCATPCSSCRSRRSKRRSRSLLPAPFAVVEWLRHAPLCRYQSRRCSRSLVAAPARTGAGHRHHRRPRQADAADQGHARCRRPPTRRAPSAPTIPPPFPKSGTSSST